MNISELKLIHAIRHYQPISKESIQSYMFVAQQTDCLFLASLFHNSNLKINNYYELEQYVHTVTKTYFSLWPQYNLIEQAWINFFIILQAYQEQKDIPILINKYKTLPPLHTTNKLIKWIAYQIKVRMLYKFTLINEDNKQLLNEIKNTPDEIKQLRSY